MKFGIEIYYIIINIIAFLAYFSDKRKAIKKSYRISEVTLITLSLLGGGIGSLLGMRAFRHKTKKVLFQIVVPASIVLHVYLYYKFFMV